MSSHSVVCLLVVFATFVQYGTPICEVPSLLAPRDQSTISRTSNPVIVHFHWKPVKRYNATLVLEISGGDDTSFRRFKNVPVPQNENDAQISMKDPGRYRWQVEYFCDHEGRVAHSDWWKFTVPGGTGVIPRPMPNFEEGGVRVLLPPFPPSISNPAGIAGKPKCKPRRPV